MQKRWLRKISPVIPRCRITVRHLAMLLHEVLLSVSSDVFLWVSHRQGDYFPYLSIIGNVRRTFHS